MTPETTRAPQLRFEVRLTSDSRFAWTRTRLAIERTMIATYSRSAWCP